MRPISSCIHRDFICGGYHRVRDRSRSPRKAGMDDRHSLSHFAHVVHRSFLWLLIGSYALAGLAPAPGLAIRGVTLGGVTLPMLMLAALLGNAGLGIEPDRLKTLVRCLHVLLGGLLANLLVPVAFLFG